MTDTRKDIPPPTAPNFNNAIREAIQVYQGRRGNPLDKGVTFRDLQKLGVSIGPGGVGGAGGGWNPGGGPGGKEDDEPDLTPPPTPTGFAVESGITYLYLQHDAPIFTMGHGYERTVVYGKVRVAGDPEPTFADAVRITDFIGMIGAHPTNPATTWHLWIKWQTRDGVESVAPAGGTNGLVATTGQDVRALLDAITQAAQSPSAPFTRLAIRAGLFYIANDVANTSTPLFSVVTAPITMNGVQVPTGVYMAEAYVMNGTITNAKMANLSVDNAKVANMAVSKLLAGSMVIGQWITSANYVAGQQGWAINAAGNAEFHNATVRGTIYASAGSIGGILINAGAVYSANYSWNGTGFYFGSDGNVYINSLRARGAVMGGSYGGYAWPAAGTTGFYLGAEGLLIGNANNGRYLQLDSQGNLYAPNFSIVDGNVWFNGSGYFNGGGVFNGNLSAAGGTFSGSMTADAVNAVNTINLAGKSVTIMHYGQGGAFTPTPQNRFGTVAAMGIAMPSSSTGVVISAVMHVSNYAMQAGSGDNDPFPVYGGAIIRVVKQSTQQELRSFFAGSNSAGSAGPSLGSIPILAYDEYPQAGWEVYEIRVELLQPPFEVLFTPMTLMGGKR